MGEQEERKQKTKLYVIKFKKKTRKKRKTWVI